MIQRIKAEIERLKKELPWGSSAAQLSMECNCKNEAYNEILSFIEWLEKEQYGAPKIKGWVARYANGDLEVGKEKPRYYEYEGKTYITNPCQTIHLDESWFPELHWLDNPIEVELTISRVKTE